MLESIITYGQIFNIKDVTYMAGVGKEALIWPEGPSAAPLAEGGPAAAGLAEAPFFEVFDGGRDVVFQVLESFIRAFVVMVVNGNFRVIDGFVPGMNAA
jgi:hypothetical protein